jgi:hypothetical protein
MKTLLVGILLAILGAACNHSGGSTMTKFDTAEAAAQYVKQTDLSPPTFTLAISDNLTIGGKPDPMGLGMAIVLDAILAKGFEPDGFQQESGYRVYRYKKMKP